MNSTKSSKKDGYGMVLGKSLLVSVVVSFVLFLIFTLIFTYTNLSENLMGIFNNLIIVVSILIGSIAMAGKVNEKGWLNGAVLSLLYIVIIMLASRLFYSNEFIFDAYVTIKVILSLVSGVAGGMIGVNLK